MKWTASKIKALKGEQKISVVTAYDALSARLIDQSGIPCILVGDSLANTVLGYENTLPVTVDEMLHHTRAVKRATQDALIVADMPFMSYQVSQEQGLQNAGRFLQEAGADAVKIEGGEMRAPLISAMVANGIPVLGHIGLTPQSVKEMGYKVQGRAAAEADQLLADAKALEAAGVFAVVLECVPPAVGARISGELSIPTIGIGAGAGCDGQVLVFTDLVGYNEKVPSFVKQYAQVGQVISEALSTYKTDVESGAYPSDEHTY